MRAPNSMERDMEVVHSTTAREVNMLEIGLKIKCMEKEHFITLTKKLPMKDSGRMISFRDMERSTMKRSLP